METMDYVIFGLAVSGFLLLIFACYLAQRTKSRFAVTEEEAKLEVLRRAREDGLLEPGVHFGMNSVVVIICDPFLLENDDDKRDW